MKAILIINNPENCAECKLVDYWSKVQEYHCRYLENRYLKKYDEKPVDCPLRPIPEKELSFPYDGYFMGWNDCIEKILEEKE